MRHKDSRETSASGAGFAAWTTKGTSGAGAVDAWLNDLPSLADGEFLLPVGEGEDLALFCVRELTWPEALEIDTRAFRTTETGATFFAEAYEQRETLKRAIRWVADLNSHEIDHNRDGDILARLRHRIVTALVDAYFPAVHLGAKEAQALYAAALAYFQGRAQEGHPLPPLVVEVDLLLKFGGLSRQEMRAITVGEMERMQLILMARSEALGLTNSAGTDPERMHSNIVRDPGRGFGATNDIPNTHFSSPDFPSPTSGLSDVTKAYPPGFFPPKFR